jgi:sugar lactone lactonase YvrE
MEAARTLWSGDFSVTSPVVIDEQLLVASTSSGQLLRLGSDGELAILAETNGRPSAIAVDPSNGDLFIADIARQSIVKSEGSVLDTDNPGQLAQFLDQFEGQPFRGPTGIALDEAGEVYFTDGGAFGDTGLHNPRGTVYRTVQGRQQVVAMTPPSLAYPTGIACAANSCVYVCEFGANRVLRFAQRPQGVFHGTVFVQLAGFMGPTAVVVHPRTHDVYVARFDLSSCSREGAITVFTSAGEEKGTLPLPGAEITGLCFNKSGNSLYVTERNTIYSVNVA